MPNFDIRTPAVLMRLDRNPFHHGTLGAVRSLGRAGIEVHAVIESPRSPVSRSRYLRGTHLWPERKPDLAGVHRRLLAVSDLLGRPAVLVPMDDVSAIAAGALRTELTGRYLLPEQPAGLAERVADKAELASLCGALGVPHPRTELPDSPAQAVAAADSLGLPVVAKWSRPWLLPEGSGLRSTQVVRTAREAGDLCARHGEADSRLLLQELLPPGPGLDWFFHGYAGRDADCRVSATGRKERSWPVGAGLTAVGRWLPNPDVERSALRIVESLGYRGILDLDFRRDPGTGAYHLLDFNPRPGAQFRLFADRAGTDVVRALHLDLTGRQVPAAEPDHGRTFVVENYALLSCLSSGLRRPPGAGPGSRVSWQNTEAAWFAADDPRPAGAMALAWSRHAARRALRRVGRPRRAVPVTAGPPPPRRAESAGPPTGPDVGPGSEGAPAATGADTGHTPSVS